MAGPNGQTVFDPYLPLHHQPKNIVSRVLRERRQRRDEEKRFKALIEVYRTMVQTEAYKTIADESATVLGEQLTRLVQAALKCTCGCGVVGIAERINLLHEVVRQPINALWFEDQRVRLQESAEEMSTEHES